MAGENRHRKIKEINDHADKIGSNKKTLVFLIATLTDKGLTKFHKEYLAIKKGETKDA